jgi:hypothetical protein
MTPKQRKRGFPKAKSIPERYRLLGERLGVPYPVPRNGSWDAEMVERWNRSVDVVGMKLIRLQPEFRALGRRVGSRTGPRSTIKESRKKFAQLERRAQRLKARYYELLEPHFRELAERYPMSLSLEEHREAMEQCWDVYRERFDSDAAAIGYLEATPDDDWRKWFDSDATYTAFWGAVVKKERGEFNYC